jgi:hypothetical protein
MNGADGSRGLPIRERPILDVVPVGVAPIGVFGLVLCIIQLVEIAFATIHCGKASPHKESIYVDKSLVVPLLGRRMGAGDASAVSGSRSVSALDSPPSLSVFEVSPEVCFEEKVGPSALEDGHQKIGCALIYARRCGIAAMRLYSSASTFTPSSANARSGVSLLSFQPSSSPPLEYCMTMPSRRASMPSPL